MEQTHKGDDMFEFVIRMTAITIGAVLIYAGTGSAYIAIGVALIALAVWVDKP